MQQIEPIFEARFSRDSYACRKGKGTHAALDRCQYFARRYRYVLQCDIVQFFPAVDHTILRNILFDLIADEQIRWLINLILNTGAGVLKKEYDMVYFPGDDLFAIDRPRGLAIGNLTSQFWANVYLNPLDHFIKRHLRCKGYVRYVDDLLLFAHDKQTLWNWYEAVTKRLADFRLTAHAGTYPRPVTEGIPFLGFRIFPDQIRLKRRKGIQYRRKFHTMLNQYQAFNFSPWGLRATHSGIEPGNTDCSSKFCSHTYLL